MAGLRVSTGYSGDKLWPSKITQLSIVSPESLEHISTSMTHHELIHQYDGMQDLTRSHVQASCRPRIIESS